ncbi:hypothetical protein Rsub_04425 [Raphidocelis subcapitata]|uniref:50S ribosomal protein L13 n=1 Tax=Raphidocelis subcapitata TaxID=307507 RepID=A0A2V0NWR1_9CHLO|nr:hypothetical protein Rsub_04425 [Raphidocelis subcapitata]|eukprot:GBF92078.1 hypothetical protein Rsub_04425 [Raphidocelis subcapitata]
MATPAAPLRAFAGLDRINLEGLRFRLIDAEGQVVGRLAAQLAKVLQGKDKPTYSPSRDLGDVCVVVNAEKIVFTGRKWEGKAYQWHTGRPGGLREMTARELWRRDPAQVLARAVEGMLPKNNLQPDRMRKLRVFAGPEHPYGATPMVPWSMPPKQLEDHKLGWALPQGFEPMNPEAYARRMRGARVVAGSAAAEGGGEAQQRPAADAGAGAGAAGQQQQQGEQQGEQRRQQQGSAPAIVFDDLLAADERALIEESRKRGGGGSRRGAR